MKRDLEDTEKHVAVLCSKLQFAEAQVESLCAELATWKKKRSGSNMKLDSNVRLFLVEMQRLGNVAEKYLIGTFTYITS